MALGPHAAREQGRRPNWICEHRVLVQYQGHHGGQGQPGLSVTRRKTTPLLREPTRNEATGGFSGPAGHVHSQRRKTKSTERGVTVGSLRRASGANSRAHAVAPKCDIQLGHPTPPALSQLRKGLEACRHVDTVQIDKEMIPPGSIRITEDNASTKIPLKI